MIRWKNESYLKIDKKNSYLVASSGYIKEFELNLIKLQKFVSNWGINIR